MLPQLVAVALVAAVTVVVSTAVEVASPSVRPAAAAPVAGGLGFTALAAPCRAADTRLGGGALGPAVTRSFQVGGPGSLAAQGGNPAGCGVPDGAGAVEVAVTAVSPSGNGFLRAAAAGEVIPQATFLNYSSGVGITNTGTIPLAASGTQDLSVENFVGTTHVVVDVLGYFTTAGAGGYTPLASPCRAVDTRSGGGQLTSGQGAARNVQVAGTGATFAAQGGTAGGCGVPDGVPAAVVSITAVGPSGNGFLRAGPNTGAAPAATVVNYTNGVGITNTGALPLASAAVTDLSLLNFGTATHVVVDVLGYYSPATGSRYQTITPCRAVDSRAAPGFTPGADTTRLYQLGGEGNYFPAQGFISDEGCNVPDRAAAVAAAVTAVSPQGNGFARLFPAGGAANGTFLNFTTGRSITNAGVLSLANGGLHDLALKSFGAASNFVVDVFGYYEPPATNPNPVGQLAAGAFHSCRTAAFGHVECWGGNTNGQVGDGTTSTTDRTMPLRVAGLTGATSVVAGALHTCAIVSDRSVKCWGANTYGQLGDGTATDRPRPTTVQGLNAVVAIAAGEYHTCALTNSRVLSCWGLNDSGQLGTGNTNNRAVPTEVSGLPADVSTVSRVQAGRSHTCALLLQSTIKCWGGNAEGQLGDGTTTDRLTPSAVTGLTDAAAISVTGYHSCAIKADGTTRCWGDNSYGQLGDGTTTDRSLPTGVVGLADATALTGSEYHTCALRSTGTLACWGYNGNGQLGDGPTTPRPNPTAVPGLTGAVAVTAGSGHTCAVLAVGSARCWGWNVSGQLGDGTTTNRATPTTVPSTSGTTSTSVGPFHSCALDSNGTAQCWGDNGYGQIGDGTALVDRSVPTAVAGLTGVVSTAAGRNHTCALLAGGTAKCWGDNGNGQLGDGTTTNRATPTTVTGLTGAVAISAGVSHTCALLANRTAKCWGGSFFGQVGDGTTTSRSTPTTVTGLTNAVSISAGGVHTCALLTDSTAKCWGGNDFRQVGDGTTTSRSTPTTVTGLTGAVSISAGGVHTCALLTDGTAKCWGGNTQGQVGDGTTTTRATPTSVAGLAGAVSISAGENHSCALLPGGTARCWGDNAYGQIGDGTTTDRSLITVVTGLDRVRTIGAGEGHSCALLTDGTAKCWGNNFYGQIGDGTTTDRLTPTPVFGLG